MIKTIKNDAKLLIDFFGGFYGEYFEFTGWN